MQEEQAMADAGFEEAATGGSAELVVESFGVEVVTSKSAVAVASGLGTTVSIKRTGVPLFSH
jgi:hypothetical protein